jgi:hypothetical protein
MSLVNECRLRIRRISNGELMKVQDIVQEEVTRRETSKYNTKGEEVERNRS